MIFNFQECLTMAYFEPKVYTVLSETTLTSTSKTVLNYFFDNFHKIYCNKFKEQIENTLIQRTKYALENWSYLKNDQIPFLTLNRDSFNNDILEKAVLSIIKKVLTEPLTIDSTIRIISLNRNLSKIYTLYNSDAAKPILLRKYIDDNVVDLVSKFFVYRHFVFRENVNDYELEVNLYSYKKADLSVVDINIFTETYLKSILTFMTLKNIDLNLELSYISKIESFFKGYEYNESITILKKEIQRNLNFHKVDLFAVSSTLLKQFDIQDNYKDFEFFKLQNVNLKSVQLATNLYPGINKTLYLVKILYDGNEIVMSSLQVEIILSLKNNYISSESDFTKKFGNLNLFHLSYLIENNIVAVKKNVLRLRKLKRQYQPYYLYCYTNLNSKKSTIFESESRAILINDYSIQVIYFLTF